MNEENKLTPLELNHSLLHSLSPIAKKEKFNTELERAHHFAQKMGELNKQARIQIDLAKEKRRIDIENYNAQLKASTLSHNSKIKDSKVKIVDLMC